MRPPAAAMRGVSDEKKACRHAAACGRLRSVSDENFDIVDEHRAFGEERERREKPAA